MREAFTQVSDDSPLKNKKDAILKCEFLVKIISSE